MVWCSWGSPCRDFFQIHSEEGKRNLHCFILVYFIPELVWLPTQSDTGGWRLWAAVHAHFHSQTILAAHSRLKAHECFRESPNHSTTFACLEWLECRFCFLFSFWLSLQSKTNSEWFVESARTQGSPPGCLCGHSSAFLLLFTSGVISFTQRWYNNNNSSKIHGENILNEANNTFEVEKQSTHTKLSIGVLYPLACYDRHIFVVYWPHKRYWGNVSATIFEALLIIFLLTLNSLFQTAYTWINKLSLTLLKKMQPKGHAVQIIAWLC